MRVGYLINTYPMTSQTFIRREIRALECHGVNVTRYAIRRWSEPLVDELNIAEQSRTHYILTGRWQELAGQAFAEVFTNPIGLMRGLALCVRMILNNGGNVLRHIAYLVEAISLRRWTKRDKIPHVHAHFSTNSAAVALLAHRIGGPTFSFTAHGQQEFDNARATSMAEKVSNAAFVVAISHYCRVQLARAAGMSNWNKLHVIRSGIDPRQFDLSRTPFKDNLRFVCVGRLCSEKAQDLLISAVRQVVRKHPTVQIDLIGDGETRAAIEAEIARHGVGKNVTLFGWRSNDEVREIIASSRALVLPSFAEGLPIVIMEALALGRPVISTFVNGIPELVDETCGWLVPAGSVDQTASAIISAIEASPEQLEQMGQEGRRRVLTNYDIFSNAGALKDLLAASMRAH